jgi:hypothetical protein
MESHLGDPGGADTDPVGGKVRLPVDIGTDFLTILPKYLTALSSLCTLSSSDPSIEGNSNVRDDSIYA